MFIDNATTSITRAPAERNVLQWCVVTDFCFAPLERGEIFEGRAFHKRLAPNGAKIDSVLLRF